MTHKVIHRTNLEITTKWSTNCVIEVTFNDIEILLEYKPPTYYIYITLNYI